mmetsp:Transcript_1692/g.5058  ORF Transcript_1692/g.5058 Transcript_1692/m.5058 type:complete len:81 (-) Transcript_1692:174-416(-)
MGRDATDGFSRTTTRDEKTTLQRFGGRESSTKGEGSSSSFSESPDLRTLSRAMILFDNARFDHSLPLVLFGVLTSLSDDD